MKIAIDIDGTVTRWPEQCRALLDAAVPPAELVFLTGVLTEFLVAGVSPVTGRVHQLAKFGFLVTPADIHVCVGRRFADVARLKGEYCRDRKIDLFIDDTKEYCEAVRTWSPHTLVLHVFP